MTDDSQKIACDWCGQRVYPFDLYTLASGEAICDDCLEKGHDA